MRGGRGPRGKAEPEPVEPIGPPDDATTTPASGEIVEAGGPPGPPPSDEPPTPPQAEHGEVPPGPAHGDESEELLVRFSTDEPDPAGEPDTEEGFDPGRETGSLDAPGSGGSDAGPAVAEQAGDFSLWSDDALVAPAPAAAPDATLVEPDRAARPVPYEPRSAASADDSATSRRMARIHLRTGSLALARAELELLAGRNLLDLPGLLDLAEARWRTGELPAGGDAAVAYIGAGGENALGFVIAAEAQAVAGRRSEERRYVALALERCASGLDAVFAGIPARANWTLSTTEQPDESAVEPVAEEPTGAAGQPAVEPVEPGPEPVAEQPPEPAQPAVELAVEPVAEPAVEPAQPAVEPAVEPAGESAEAAAQPESEPVAEQPPEPAQPESEPVAEQPPEPAQPAVEPAVEPARESAEAAAQPESEPVAEQPPEPAQPAVEPAVEPAQAPPLPFEVRRAQPWDEEVRSGAAALASDDALMAALHLAVALRSAPEAARDVLDTIGERADLPLQLVRADALMALGNDADADQAYRSVADSMTPPPPGTVTPAQPESEAAGRPPADEASPRAPEKAAEEDLPQIKWGD
jgi:hypothetical protein